MKAIVTCGRQQHGILTKDRADISPINFRLFHLALPAVSGHLSKPLVGSGVGFRASIALTSCRAPGVLFRMSSHV